MAIIVTVAVASVFTANFANVNGPLLTEGENKLERLSFNLRVDF